MRLAIVLCLLAGSVQAQSMALQLPNPPMNYQSDRFRAGNLDCSNAVGGGTNLEFGVTGVFNDYDDPFTPTSKDMGIYARVVIPLDKPKSRINCDDLYRLELRQRRLEIIKLEEELRQLRELKGSMEFEN